MTTSSIPPVVRDYLAELDRELAGVPDEIRQGIVAGIAEELEGLGTVAATVRISTLGDPAFIAAEARAGVAPRSTGPPSTGPESTGPESTGPRSTGPRSTGPESTGPRPTSGVRMPARVSEQRWYVFVTTALLCVGGLVVPLGGWVVGIMMMLASPLWTRNEKLVAAIVPAAVGIVLFWIVAFAGSGFAGSGFAVWHALLLGGLVGPILASIVIGIVLSRRARDRAS